MYRLWLNRKLAFSQFKSEKLFTSLLVSVCSRVFARDICCYNIYYSVQCDTNWLWNALVCESIFEISCYYTIIWSHYRFSLLKDGIMLFCHMRVMAFIEWLTREKMFYDDPNSSIHFSYFSKSSLDTDLLHFAIASTTSCFVTYDKMGLTW